MVHLLQAVVEHGTGRAAALGNEIVAGKTGASQDHRDAWFVGFNKALVVGVWVGNDDQTPMKGVTGGSLPVEIWKRFVEAALPILNASPRLELARGTSDSSTASVRDQPQCDQAACAAAYRSFRASDCTFQSYGGSRKLCLKPLDRELQAVEARFDTDRAGRRERRRVFAAEQTPELLTAQDIDGSAPEGARSPRRGSAFRGPSNMPPPSSVQSESRPGPRPTPFGPDSDRP